MKTRQQLITEVRAIKGVMRANVSATAPIMQLLGDLLEFLQADSSFVLPPDGGSAGVDRSVAAVELPVRFDDTDT